MVKKSPAPSFCRQKLGLAFLCVLCASVVQISSAFAQREYGFDNTKPSGQPYLKPEESLARMKVADGFEIHLAAAEPAVINPIAFTLDEKGRIWVVESFEYPKKTPKGKMPRDRIKILESTKGDGVFDKVTVFAEGKDFPMSFDMASGIEVGHGGVYLGAPPYLWFIENKNDKPGKFEILLKGFGSQDTHETLNTFTWGPDGWLYGCQGVFTQSEVEAPDAKDRTKLNAGVWRFHPKTKKFEIFAEGTSNPWGLDWRNTDGQFILCCCVIPHLYHIVPGGIYRRQAGASYNPYAYGEIKEICDHTFHKESGWAHAGLISLDAPHIPKQYQDSVIFGSIHGCSVKRNVLKHNGSSFIASRAEDFLVSGDKNFRPINMKWGPSGEIYLIDWHDQNPCHQAKPDAWDYEHGRIFRIQVKGTHIKKAEDLNLGADLRLAKTVIENDSPWHWRTALRLLSERWDLYNMSRPPMIPLDVYDIGEDGLKSKDAGTRLRSALLLRIAGRASSLSEPDAVVRAWNLREFIPGPTQPVGQSKKFEDMAATEDRPEVRREIASTMRSYGADFNSLPILHGLLRHKEDLTDPIIPLMVWWAYEPKLVAAAKDELAWLRDNSTGNPLVTDAIIPRAMSRLAATSKADDLAACVSFIGELKNSAVRKRALEGLAFTMQNRIFDAPPQWAQVSAALSEDKDPEVQKLARKLAVNFRDPAAVKRALAIATDAAKPLPERLDAVRAIGVLRPEPGAALLLNLLHEAPAELRAEAMRALASFENPEIANGVLLGWAEYPPALRAEAANTLATRKPWAKALLDAVGAKKVARTDLTDNTILRIRSFNDRGLNQQIETVWGKFRATPKDLEALIDKMRGVLNDGPGSFTKGKAVFEQQCAKCHNFEGRGASVGPQLDGAARDIEYLLVNILDPNRVIGQPYFVHVVERKNGTNEIGLLAGEDEQTLTLKVENGVLKVIPKKEIETHTIQEKSMMPEGLAAGMSLQDFRDLVRYVMANPFLTNVKVADKPVKVGVPGRIPLPSSKEETRVVISAEVTAPSAGKYRLQIGAPGRATVRVNGAAATPERGETAVELKEGVNTVAIELRYRGDNEAAFARFLDPDRKLRYTE